MLRLLLLLVIVAGVAGYFTNPTEAKMREAAEAVLNDPDNIVQGFENLGAAVAGDRQYTSYYVASKYVITLGDDPLVECWGAFTQTQCQRVAQAAAEQ